MSLSAENFPFSGTPAVLGVVKEGTGHSQERNCSSSPSCGPLLSPWWPSEQAQEGYLAPAHSAPPLGDTAAARAPGTACESSLCAATVQVQRQLCLHTEKEKSGPEPQHTARSRQSSDSPALGQTNRTPGGLPPLPHILFRARDTGKRPSMTVASLYRRVRARDRHDWSGAATTRARALL